MRIRVRIKIRFRFKIRFRVSVRVKDMVKLVMVFGVQYCFMFATASNAISIVFPYYLFLS